MQTFKIQDEKTGMVVDIEGESAPSVEQLPEIFTQAQRGAEELLSSGGYGIRDYQRLDGQARKDRLRNLTAQALRTAPEDVDVDSGMGTWERMKLNFLPTQKDRMDYLEKTYGSDNVGAVNIDGEARMFYRDPKQGYKMVMVNDDGFSL